MVERVGLLRLTYGQNRRADPRKEVTMEAFTDTLIARVDRLVGAKDTILSTTPTSVAIAELLSRQEALENAVREVALELTQLSRRLDARHN